MSKLAEWSAQQPDWASDALRRAAASAEIDPADVRAVAIRVGLAHGVPADGDQPCEPYSDDKLKADSSAPDDVILCSVGPLEGVDRLLENQELKFALDGLTVVFGENGSGKSGYARVLRRICQARVPVKLQGDVYAKQGTRERRVSFKVKRGDGEPETEVWVDGAPPPGSLSGISIIDTDNAEVYVAGDNEILFLPAEVGCLTRLGKLYAAVAEHLQTEANVLANSLGGSYGDHLNADTKAGSLVRKLVLSTKRDNLPNEEQIKISGDWNDDLEAELTALEQELSQSPAAIAVRFKRIADAADVVVTYIKQIESAVTGEELRNIFDCIDKAKTAKSAANTLASEQIGGQPLVATGSDVWKTLYEYARAFAAETELRKAHEPFLEGDPCPLCQQALSLDAAERLALFDQFVEGKASIEAKKASDALNARKDALNSLAFRTTNELQQILAEFAAQGDDELEMATHAIEWNARLKERCVELLAAIANDDVAPIGDLVESPCASLEEAIDQIRKQHEQAAKGAALDVDKIMRAKELVDQRALHKQLAEITARRASLDRRLGLLECIAALNTGPISRLASTIRKDLVTPELSSRVRAELNGLGLAHIPLEFKEASRHGTSFFEMALATPQRAEKARVMSEGEQRAMSLACFLADNHVASRKSGLIFDDPVTSLDHQRIRRVARRLVQEAAKRRQIIVFTHNVLFYQELLRACADAHPQIPALPCLVRQSTTEKFGRVTVNDEPWIAKKVTARETDLANFIEQVPDQLTQDDPRLRIFCTSFYTALRETWERLVEEILLNGVVERFGSDVGTLRLRGVEVTPDDHKTIYFAMKRASEYSGHDQAGARQIDLPDKAQMRADLKELVDYRISLRKRIKQTEEDRKKLEEPPNPMVA